MATKRELVDAYQFSRRRLVTAFLSGAPGGREVEPARPGRTIVGGVALAVLLCAGAGVAGFLGGRPDAGWTEAGSFVISKDTGEQYVVLRDAPESTDGEDAENTVIQRIPNFISAQLLLGTPEPQVFTVRDSHIRTLTLGADLGIEGAPAGLPPAEELIGTGWSACTAADLGVKVHLSPTPDVQAAPEGGFVVRSEAGEAWLVAASPDGPAYRFALPRGQTAQSTLLDALGFGARDTVPVVSQQWLNLFPLGPALTLTGFGVTGAGQPADYPGLRTDLTGFVVGDLVQTPDGSRYLLAQDAPQRLEEFPAALYEALATSARPLSSDLVADFAAPSHPEEWPAAAPTPITGELCALLQQRDSVSHVVPATEPGADASAQALRPGSHDVDVEPSGGAYVLAGADAATAGGSPYVIDAKGAKYPLVGPDVAQFIGYGDVDPPVVPDAWLGWFSDGVVLSVNAARRVPEDADDPKDGS